MNSASRYTRVLERSGPVPLSTKIFQGVGALPDTHKNFAFGTFLLFFYNQVLGMPALLASVAIMIALVVDAVTDPLVGSYSDSLRTRFGRRHPLMYAAAVPLGLSLFLVFVPPAGLSHAAQFAWLLVFSVATRVAMAFYLVPWNALFAEFSDDYAERSAIVTFRYLWGWIGGVTFVWCTWTFVFPRGAPPATVAIASVQLLGWIAGILLLLLYVVPFALTTRYGISRAVHAEIQGALHARRRTEHVRPSNGDSHV